MNFQEETHLRLVIQKGSWRNLVMDTSVNGNLKRLKRGFPLEEPVMQRSWRENTSSSRLKDRKGKPERVNGMQTYPARLQWQTCKSSWRPWTQLDSSVQRAWGERAACQHSHLEEISQAQRLSTLDQILSTALKAHSLSHWTDVAWGSPPIRWLTKPRMPVAWSPNC